MKQTAVEWLVDELTDNGISHLDLAYKIIEQAKEMEKQQIIMAFWNSKHSLCDENTDLLYLAKEYYKVKFNK
jgi:phosphoribosyl-ATP pyrophosphohydrolase